MLLLWIDWTSETIKNSLNFVSTDTDSFWKLNHKQFHVVDFTIKRVDYVQWIWIFGNTPIFFDISSAILFEKIPNLRNNPQFGQELFEKITI